MTTITTTTGNVTTTIESKEVLFSKEFINEARSLKAWGMVTFARRFNKLVAEQGSVPVVETGVTGYFDKTQPNASALGSKDYMAVVDESGRQAIICRTPFGPGVLFKRYTNTNNMVLASVVKNGFSWMVPNGNLSHNEDGVAIILGDNGWSFNKQLVEMAKDIIKLQ